jgi:hypothetical protein
MCNPMVPARRAAWVCAGPGSAPADASPPLSTTAQKLAAIGTINDRTLRRREVAKLGEVDDAIGSGIFAARSIARR